MSYGVPVLASNAASIPEVCGDAVLYCDPYSVEDISEKMRLVLLDIPLRNELIQRGKERVKLFSWDKTSEQHLDIMEQVMDND
jgi:glycosyltransferase involved in cell wall biosynthesis